jgi:hypothetical protein
MTMELSGIVEKSVALTVKSALRNETLDRF